MNIIHSAFICAVLFVVSLVHHNVGFAFEPKQVVEDAKVEYLLIVVKPTRRAASHAHDVSFKRVKTLGECILQKRQYKTSAACAPVAPLPKGAKQ